MESKILNEEELKYALDGITLSLKICSVCINYKNDSICSKCHMDLFDIDESKLPEDPEKFLEELQNLILKVLM